MLSDADLNFTVKLSKVYYEEPIVNSVSLDRLLQGGDVEWQKSHEKMKYIEAKSQGN